MSNCQVKRSLKCRFSILISRFAVRDIVCLAFPVRLVVTDLAMYMDFLSSPGFGLLCKCKMSDEADNILLSICSINNRKIIHSGSSLTMNNGPVSISNGLLLSIYIQPSRFVTICGFVFVGRLHCYDMVCYTSRSKIKRAKRPCAYYCNSSATFHCPLEGDLVFKLNPGPMDDQQTIRSHCSLVRRSSLTTRTRNLSNLITINRAPPSMRLNTFLSTVNTSFMIPVVSSAREHRQI